MPRSDHTDPGTAQRRSTDPGQRPTRRIRTPLRQRMADLRGGPLAAAAFLGAAFWLWWLVAQQPTGQRFVAVVRPDEVLLNGLEGWVVEQVHVEPYERIRPGQLLCTFDASVLSAELAVATSELERLRSEVAAELARLALEEESLALDARTADERVAVELGAERRRLIFDVEQARIDVLAREVELAELDVTRRQLNTRLEYFSELVEPGLVPASENAELAAGLEGLAVQRERQEDLLAAARDAEQLARRQFADFEFERQALPTPPAFDRAAVVEPLRRAIDVQVAVADHVRAQMDELVLRAPCSGTVAAVAARPGARAVDGIPLVTLVPDGPRTVDLWVREPIRQRLALGDRVELADPLAPAVRYLGEVTAQAPSVTLLPERLWNDPRQPEHALGYAVRLPDGAEVIAGARLEARTLP